MSERDKEGARAESAEGEREGEMEAREGGWKRMTFFEKVDGWGGEVTSRRPLLPKEERNFQRLRRIYSIRPLEQPSFIQSFIVPFRSFPSKASQIHNTSVLRREMERGRKGRDGTWKGELEFVSYT